MGFVRQFGKVFLEIFVSEQHCHIWRKCLAWCWSPIEHGCILHSCPYTNPTRTIEPGVHSIHKTFRNSKMKTNCSGYPSTFLAFGRAARSQATTRISLIYRLVSQWAGISTLHMYIITYLVIMVTPNMVTWLHPNGTGIVEIVWLSAQSARCIHSPPSVVYRCTLAILANLHGWWANEQEFQPCTCIYNNNLLGHHGNTKHGDMHPNGTARYS